MLPEVSGIQLVKRLGADEVGTPAIMLTARAQGGELTAENEDGGGASSRSFSQLVREHYSCQVARSTLIQFSCASLFSAAPS